MQHFEDSVLLAAEPQGIVARLIANVPEFTHILEATPRIAVLFSQRAVFLRGAQCNAVIVEPRWQGPLSRVTEFLYARLVQPVLEGEDPDYLIVIDIAIWSSLDLERRERLVYHELCHLQPKVDEFGVIRRGQRGQPQLKLVPHDVEVFNAEIERYGPEVIGLEDTLDSIVYGAKEAARRKAKGNAA